MSAEAGTAGRPLLMGMAGTVPDPYSHQNPVQYTHNNGCSMRLYYVALKKWAPPLHLCFC